MSKRISEAAKDRASKLYDQERQKALSRTSDTGKLEIPADLSIPAFLRREVTPQSKAAVTRIINEQKLLRGLRRVEKSDPSSISAGHSLNLDEAGKALLKEVNQAKELRKKQAFERLRELAEAKRREKLAMHTIGPKEAALQASRVSTVPPPKKTPEQLAAAIRDLNGKAAQKKATAKKSMSAIVKEHKGVAPDTKAADKPKGKAKAFEAPAPKKQSAPAKKPLMQIVEDLLVKGAHTQDEVNAAWKKAGGKSPSINLDAILVRYKKREGGKPGAKLVEANGKFHLA